MTDLTIQKERDTLITAREPHWTRVRQGVFLGFRRIAAGGEGRWIARVIASGKKFVRSLGPEDNLTYTEAKRKCEDWAGSLGVSDKVAPGSVVVKRVTVREAITELVERTRPGNPGKAAHYEQAIDILASAKLADKRLDQVTADAMQRLHDDLFLNRSLKPSSADRYWGRIRAALRLSVRTFKYACDLDVLKVAPVEGLSAELKPVKSVLTTGQVRAVMACLSDRDCPFFGCRTSRRGGHPV